MLAGKRYCVYTIDVQAVFANLKITFNFPSWTHHFEKDRTTVKHRFTQMKAIVQLSAFICVHL